MNLLIVATGINDKFKRLSFFARSTFIVFVFSLVLSLNYSYVKPTFNQLMDFGSFLAAGKASFTLGDPYSSNLPLVYKVESNKPDINLSSPNLNPPISILFFRLFSQFSPSYAALIWRWTSIIVFVFTIGLLFMRLTGNNSYLILLWSVSVAGIWSTISLGQIYAPLLLFASMVVIKSEEDQFILSGIFLGFLIALKPNFLFWCLLLMVARQSKMVLSAFVTTTILTLIPIPILGLHVYDQWFNAIEAYPSLGLMIAGNSSLLALGAISGSVTPSILLSALVISGSIWVSTKFRHSLNFINTAGIIRSILLSPFAWPGYTMLALPIFFTCRNWNWGYVYAATLLAVPYVIIVSLYTKSAFFLTLFSWLYGWGLLLLLLSAFYHLKYEEKHKREIALSIM